MVAQSFEHLTRRRELAAIKNLLIGKLNLEPVADFEVSESNTQKQLLYGREIGIYECIRMGDIVLCRTESVKVRIEIYFPRIVVRAKNENFLHFLLIYREFRFKFSREFRLWWR
jgi:hypothetical protein